MSVLAIVAGVTLRIIACDQIHLEDETWLTAKTHLIRILDSAGVELVWTDAVRGTKECKPTANDGEFLVVVAADPPKGWTTPDAMGFAPLNTRRIYVFFSRMKQFISSFIPAGDERTTLGILLGHAIAHELGHAMIPVNAHGGAGIMHANWSLREWQLMLAGSLLFDSDRARSMRNQIRSRQVPAPGSAGERAK